MLVIPDDLAQRAREREEEYLKEFAQRASELSAIATVKEAARILNVSARYLRSFSRERGIEYLPPGESSPFQGLLRKKRKESRWQSAPRRLQGACQREVTPELQIPPGLLAKGARELWRRQSMFVERAIELSHTCTLNEAAARLGITPAGLMRIARDQDIVFQDQPQGRKVASSAASLKPTVSD